MRFVLLKKQILTTTLYFPERQAAEAWQQTEGGGGVETPEVAETASSVNMARDTELRPARASHQCHRWEMNTEIFFTSWLIGLLLEQAVKPSSFSIRSVSGLFKLSFSFSSERHSLKYLVLFIFLPFPLILLDYNQHDIPGLCSRHLLTRTQTAPNLL